VPAWQGGCAGSEEMAIEERFPGRRRRWRWGGAGRGHRKAAGASLQAHVVEMAACRRGACSGAARPVDAHTARMCITPTYNTIWR